MKLHQIAFFSAMGLTISGLALADEKKTLDIPVEFKDKLIKVEDGKIVDAELTGDPEYYVLYYSASW